MNYIDLLVIKPADVDLSHTKIKSSLTMESTHRKVGWVFLSFLILAMNGGIFYCNGFFFSEFVIRLEANPVVVSSLSSIQTSLCMVTGLFGPFLVRILGYKNIVILGSIMLSTGLAVCAFVEDIALLFPFFAIIPGIGLGFQMFGATLVNQNIFQKHRALVFGIILSGSSVGVFIFGFVIEALLRLYGWRGTLLMLSAIVFHAVPIGMCMSSGKQEKDSRTTIQTKDTLEPIITRSPDTPHSSLALSIELCKNKVYLGILVVIFLMNFGGCVAGVFSPHFIRLRFGESVYSSYWISCISVLGAGDLCGRLSAALIGNWLPMSKLLMILFDALLFGISYLMIPYSSAYILVLVSIFFVGIALGFFISILPSTVVDLFGVEKLNRAYGMSKAFAGAAFLLSSPFHAFLINSFDGRLDVVFILAGICGFTTSVVVFLSYLCFRKCPRAQDRVVSIQYSEA